MTDTLPKKHVLLLEDDPAYSGLVQTWITQYLPGWTCALLSTVEEALGCLSSTVYDLVIIDASLPGYSRVLAISAVVDLVRPHGTPVIVLSGLPQSFDADAIQAGAKLYLCKNDIVSADKFIAVVTQIVSEDASPVRSGL